MSKKITLESKYGGEDTLFNLNDSYDSDFYCPNCGETGTLYEELEGDYYEGPNIFCTNCEHEFTMPTRPHKSDRYNLKG